MGRNEERCCLTAEQPYAFARKGVVAAISQFLTAHNGGILHTDSHRDTVEDMVRKGRDLQKIVLSRAVRWHLENRVLVYQNKTVVFV